MKSTPIEAVFDIELTYYSGEKIVVQQFTGTLSKARALAARLHQQWKGRGYVVARYVRAV